jgi:threonylcarbamoyladenosine tRNA methylthiotransferase MtaB
MKVFLDSIGCRLNQAEMEKLARQLLAAGHDLVDDPAAADRVVINTCAVTRQAEREGRKRVRRAHAAGPAAEILLTGCQASLKPEALARLPGVTQVLPNAQKDRLIELFDQAPAPWDLEPILREARARAGGSTRAFVKVQDGCDKRCSFCVTTLARGAGRSRPLAEVVAEVAALAAAGYQEAVLTGVHLGSYGLDWVDTGAAGSSAPRLRDLIRVLLDRTDIARLRLSSLEPWDIPGDFFELWQDPRLLPHLHLPLQAGCDATLRRMARGTTTAAFGALVDEACAAIPDLQITTDVIVGFPGEREVDFAESLDFVREMGFGRLHVFSYSERPGTAAASMPDPVPSEERKERARRMIALGQELAADFAGRFVGREMRVLWESGERLEQSELAHHRTECAGALEDPWLWTGYSENYLRVQARGPAGLRNRIMPVRVSELRGDALLGDLG